MPLNEIVPQQRESEPASDGEREREKERKGERERERGERGVERD